ncbi:type VI secretion system-associated protein VasI [Halomonas citrativorans]|uniref:Type VI secretion system-associated protein TagO n=1 Tax=Halomonas citrativorans TaxID=2742612 RepID=A0ABR9FGW5_9GAMM|nr:type VI secretion system-associated protein VasI [Halomonas citrativorans]MBE0404855.1 type VI secretion system-associated protein TagO [Halomonas citrativorans]
MNAMLRKRQWTIGGLLMLCLLACTPSKADEQSALLKSAQTCAEETSRLERLNCYDALFLEANLSVDENELPALWRAIERQESARPDDNVGLIVNESGESVLISVPALGTTPPRPIMVVACERLITRFQLHLPTPISGARVDLQITGNGRAVQQQWRIRDGGRVVSGGRGLPAIDTLRQLLDANEVTLRSDIKELDGLRFNVAGLRQEIAPLREACRW